MKLNNVKNTTKFQVLRASCKLLYNLQLDNYSFKSERVVEKSSYQAEDCFFTIIQLNRSIVHDIEHFISAGNNFMV